MRLAVARLEVSSSSFRKYGFATPATITLNGNPVAPFVEALLVSPFHRAPAVETRSRLWAGLHVPMVFAAVSATWHLFRHQ